jgi:cytochrome P450
MTIVMETNGLDLVEPALRGVDFASMTVTGVMEILDGLRDSGRSVVPVRYFGKVAWTILGFDAVEAAFMNEAQMPKAPYWIRDNEPYFGRVVSSMMGEEHRAHRAIVGGPLMPGKIRARVAEVLIPVADGLIDAFAGRRDLDLVESFNRLYPFRVISALLGLPPGDEPLVHDHVMRLFRFGWDPVGAREARDAMIAYLRPYLELRRKQPRGDLISLLAAAEVNGKRLTDQELLDAVRFLYPAAGDNTTHALGVMMYRVLSNDTVHARVLAEPTDRHAAIEETLRMEPPVPLIIRFIENAVAVRGFQIPAQSYVLLAIGSANLDPSRFDDPLTFSLDRGTNNHITFGRGPHFCLGTHLARAEMRAALDALLDRLPGLRLVDRNAVILQGGTQRGPGALRVTFDDVLPAAEPS